MEEVVGGELATEIVHLRGKAGFSIQLNSNSTLRVFPGIPEPGLPGPSVHAFSSLAKSSLAFPLTEASGKTTHKDTDAL